MFRCLIILLFPFILVGQNKTIDSLKLALKKAKHDTTRCIILNALIISENDDAVWSQYNEELLKLSETKLKTTNPSDPEYTFYKENYTIALNNFGYLVLQKGNVPKALEYFGKVLKIQEESQDKQGMSPTLHNIGAIHERLGDIPRALEYYGKSLKIQEEIGDRKGMAYSLNSIGFIHFNQGDITKGLENLNKSLRIYERIGDMRGVSNVLNNIGYACQNQFKPLKGTNKSDSLHSLALEYYEKSLKIRKEISYKSGIATSLNNIGSVLFYQGNMQKALDYYFSGLEIQEELGDKQGIANTFANIGSIYLEKKDYSKAIEFCSRSMKLSKELGFPQNIRNAAQGLNTIYKATGKYKLALENYELYIQMRDSINNETTRKASIKQQLKHEYETKAAADSVAHAKESEIKNAELKKQEAEIKVKKNQQYALFGGLGLVMVFAGFMYNRFKVTQRQKAIIEIQKAEVEEQKKLVEHKQKEILDSIHYARRIQLAQIPSEKRVLTTINRLRT